MSEMIPVMEPLQILEKGKILRLPYLTSYLLILWRGRELVLIKEGRVISQLWASISIQKEMTPKRQVKVLVASQKLVKLECI